MEQLCPMPPATVNPGRSHPNGAGCVTPTTRAAVSPPSKIQAVTHQASLKRKIKNDSAHCWWASTIRQMADRGTQDSRSLRPAATRRSTAMAMKAKTTKTAGTRSRSDWRPGRGLRAIPTLLALPNRAVAGVTKGRRREPLLRRLQLLQADDVRRGLGESAQEHRQTAVDAVDVEGSDLHPSLLAGVGVPV